jgi:hypothetical protein
MKEAAMGFLSAYSGTRRVTVGDPERGYWVELRETVSQGAKAKAEQELMGRQQINGGDVTTQMNVVGFHHQMVLASIINWNLDDDNGHIWPLNMQSIQRLPGPVFDYLWSLVDEMNAPRGAVERRRFRDAGDDGSEVGTELTGGSGEPQPVLAAPAALDEAGDEPGAAG